MTNDKIKLSKFIRNLDLEAVRDVALQLALYPETREYILKCAKEYWDAFTFPIKDKGGND